MSNYLFITVLFVCFFDVVVKALLPSSASYSINPDGTSARMITECTAIGLSMFILCTSGFKKLENKSAAWFVFFILFASFHGPNLIFHSAYVPGDPCLFNFKPMFDVIVFFLMFMAICSINFDHEAKERIYKSFAWVGIIYSGYIICQYFWMDQIYNLVSQDVSKLSRHPQCGGFIGQPVFASAILCMCFPFVIRYVPKAILLVLIGELATGNRTGWIAIAVSMVFFFNRQQEVCFICNRGLYRHCSPRNGHLLGISKH